MKQNHELTRFECMFNHPSYTHGQRVRDEIDRDLASYDPVEAQAIVNEIDLELDLHIASQND